MARSRNKTGNNVDSDELHGDDELSDSGSQPVEMTSERFFASLGNGDTISIHRQAPLRDRGWIANIPYTDGLDFEQEIAESYGGGTYLLRFKRRSKDGKMLFSTGSATIVISGRPRLEGGAMIPQVLSGMPASVAPDMQARLFDLLQSQLGNKSEEIPGLITRIVDVVSGRTQTQVDPMAQMMAAATSAKQLAAMFDPPKVENPATGDDDDDDDDSGDNSSTIEKFMMMMAAKMMGGQEAAKAPHSAAPMASAPPGWRQDETGRWVQLPPGWARSPNHRKGPPGPPPPGMQWMHHQEYGFILATIPRKMDGNLQPDPDSATRSGFGNQIRIRQPDPDSATRSGFGNRVSMVQMPPQSSGQNRTSTDTLPDSHQSELMGGATKQNSPESIEKIGTIKTCLMCGGDGKERSAETDEPIGPCIICSGVGSVRVDNPLPRPRYGVQPLNPCPYESCRGSGRPNEGNHMKCDSCGLNFGVDVVGNSRRLDETCKECIGEGWIDLDGKKRVCLNCEGDGFEPSDLEDDEEEDPLSPDEIADEFVAMTKEEQRATLEKMAPALGLDPAMVAALFAEQKEEGEK